MAVPNQPAQPASSRREFLANLVMGVGAALGFGGLAFRFAQFLYPVMPPVKRVQVFVSTTAALPDSGVRTFNLPAGPVILRKAGKEIRAYSGICTHLGCVVRWHTESNQFICPCHHGIYDIEGNVVSGPPPRPLNAFEVVVKNDPGLLWSWSSRRRRRREAVSKSGCGYAFRIDPEILRKPLREEASPST